MKLKFERFENLSALSVRGELNGENLKMLEIGMQNLASTLETPLLINLSVSQIPADQIPELIALKQKMNGQAKHSVQWISSVKELGDFFSTETFSSRQPTAKLRQMGEHLRLDDEVSLIKSRLLVAHEKWHHLAPPEGSERAGHLLEVGQKAKLRILRHTLHILQERAKYQTPTHPQTEETLAQLAETQKAFAAKFPGIL